MLTILTPSKTMNFTDEAPHFSRGTVAHFSKEAKQIRSSVASLSVGQIKDLMKVSDVLAQKTHDLFRQRGAKQAFWTYDGDVFKGVRAKTIDATAAAFAQDHIVVPSAIYGLVRPNDMIAPYRLEMKAKLSIGDAKNLYEFWSDTLAKYVETHADGEVLMLSSYEYARTILPYVTDTTRIVTPAFIDRKPNGDESQVAIYNKMMRGVMARWVIDNRIDSLEAIKEFSAHGYSYDATRSVDDKLVFYRPHMSPLRF
ncbi:MAG: YaaA family protein [Candidatus Saccharimonadales bacterium]